MKKLVYFILTFAIAFIVSCSSSVNENKGSLKDDQAKIEHLEDSLYNDTVSRMDKEKALELTNLYREFAKKYPKNEKSPSYLYRAAEVIVAIGNPMEGVNIYDNLIANYPKYDKIANCYFMKAFVLDNNLFMYKEAKVAYEKFMEKYPNHDLADDAAMSIKFMGKSNEDIIKEFEKN